MICDMFMVMLDDFLLIQTKSQGGITDGLQSCVCNTDMTVHEVVWSMSKPLDIARCHRRPNQYISVSDGQISCQAL